MDVLVSLLILTTEMWRFSSPVHRSRLWPSRICSPNGVDWNDKSQKPQEETDPGFRRIDDALLVCIMLLARKSFQVTNNFIWRGARLLSSFFAHVLGAGLFAHRSWSRYSHGTDTNTVCNDAISHVYLQWDHDDWAIFTNSSLEQWQASIAKNVCRQMAGKMSNKRNSYCSHNMGAIHLQHTCMYNGKQNCWHILTQESLY